MSTPVSIDNVMVKVLERIVEVLDDKGSAPSPSEGRDIQAVYHGATAIDRSTVAEKLANTYATLAGARKLSLVG